MGSKRWSRARSWLFKVKDISEATGLSIGKVRRDIRSGRVAPEKLYDLSRYVVVNKLKKE